MVHSGVEEGEGSSMDLVSRLPLLLFIILISIGVMGVLISYIRYRHLELLSLEEQNADGPMSVPAVVIHLLGTLQKRKGLLCRIHLFQEEDRAMVLDILQKNTRTGDEHLSVENCCVVSTFDCPLDHAQALADRLAGLLTEHNISRAYVDLWEPEVTPDALQQWLENETPAILHGVETSVDLISDLPEPSSENHPAVDPETGVLRMELVSRAMRRNLAEARKQFRSVLIMRIAPVGDDQGGVLPRIAKELLSICRETDLIGRSGDQELVLCMDTTCEHGEAAADRMVQTLLENGLSVHMGLAAMPEHGHSPNALFERAGTALLQAGKNEGGSVQMFDETMLVPEERDQPESFGKEVF